MRKAIIILNIVFAGLAAWLAYKHYQVDQLRDQIAVKHCSAERLTGEQVAYTNYKKALSTWAYENGVDINFDAIDSIYYFKLNK